MSQNKSKILLIAKGCAMGVADVVPGVSGGTIAFITGIYEELLKSIKSINLHALKLLMRGKIGELWRHVNGTFLLCVVGGIALSILSLSKLMVHLLQTQPILVWSFFLGLILASCVLVGREVKAWKATTVLSLIVGAVIAVVITSMTPATTPDDWWFIIFSGALAICAMILPGISGSFILLLLGKYLYILDALSSLNFKVIILFIIGAVGGIISFSHLLSWLLKKYHNVTVALLTGFMIGSLNKVWPWKEVLETYVDRHGEVKPLVESNVLPTTFESVNGTDPQLLYALLLMFAGVAVIAGIEIVAKKANLNR